jgi:hypothetical protein
MDQVRVVLQYHHYAYRTEQAYCHWMRRYIHFFGGKTHPHDLDTFAVERFLSDLAVNGEVSASTQRQALNTLFFSTARCSINLWMEKSNRSDRNESPSCPPYSARRKSGDCFDILREPMR